GVLAAARRSGGRLRAADVAGRGGVREELGGRRLRAQGAASPAARPRGDPLPGRARAARARPRDGDGARRPSARARPAAGRGARHRALDVRLLARRRIRRQGRVRRDAVGADVLGALRRRLTRGSRGEPIVVVSGLPRSGTSMMLRRLEAGGLPILSDGERAADIDNPKGYFELERIKNLEKEMDKSYLRAARGKAVKVISFLIKDLPDENDYRVL